ncbi:hypothetical protein M436DRAFT_22322, partial [Aureobasidium namibiae CBS 147.97]
MSDDTHHSSWHPALRSHNSTNDIPIAQPQQEPPAVHHDADFFDNLPPHQSRSLAADPVPENHAGETHVDPAPLAFEEPIAATESVEGLGPVGEDQVSEDTQLEETAHAESPNFIPEPTHDLLEKAFHPPEPEVHQSGDPPVTESEQVTSQESNRSAVEEAFGTLDKEEEDHVRERYEYQGQSTAADDAVDESDDAPLMQDEENLPTPGFATDAPAVNAHDVPFESFHQDPSAVTAAAEHVYEMSTEEPSFAAQDSDAFDPESQTHDDQFAEVSTTSEPSRALDEANETLRLVAEEPIEEPVQMQSQTSAAFEWGDDDQTEDFGAVVGIVPPEENSVESENMAAGSGLVASQATALTQALQEQQAQEDAPAEGEKSEEDLAAMWSAALDDDDFLDDNAVDPSGFFVEDDGEGFLDDFDTAPAHPDQILSPEQALSPGIAPVLDAQGNTVGFTKLGGPQEQINAPANPYSPAAQQSNPYLTPALPSVPLYNQQQQPVRPALNNAQSFADKSKGGYSSPYDLPEDIVQPRRRALAAAAPTQSSAPPPPPRSSSMQSVPPNAPPPFSRSATAAPSATVASPPMNQSPSVATLPPKPATASGGNRSASGFFEELPMVPKPRNRPYTPAVTAPSPAQAPAQTPPQGPPIRPPSRPVMPPSAASSGYGLADFRQPEKLPLLPDMQAAPQQLEPPQTSGPPASSRYSPAAQQAPSAVAPPATGRFSPMPPPAPAANSRYSPAPQAQAQNQAQN